MRPSRSSKSIAFIACSSLLVELVDVGDRLLEVGADELAVGRPRRAACSWRRRSGSGPPPGVKRLGSTPTLVDALLDEPAAVGLVVDRELARVAEPRRLGAQHAARRRCGRSSPTSPACEWPSSSSTRSRISCAALLVNVIARISPGRATPVCTSQATRCVSTRVLPDPAPASTSSGPSPCVTAARWGSFRPARRCSIRSSADTSAIPVEDRRGRGRSGRAAAPRAASADEDEEALLGLGFVEFDADVHRVGQHELGREDRDRVRDTRRSPRSTGRLRTPRLS